MLKKIREIEIFPKRYGYFPYVFLIYFIMPFYYISTEQGWKMFIGYLLLFIFFISYRQLYFLIDGHIFHQWIVGQLLIILILSVFYNLNFLFLGFFTAHFIAWFPEKRTFYYALGGLTITLLFPILMHLPYVLSNGYYILFMFIVIMIASPFGIRSMYRKLELERKLEEANERIEVLVKKEERLRIARDLHDTLGHTLSLITLKAQLVGKLTEKDAQKARDEALEIAKTSRIALMQVRELVSEMRTKTLAEEIIEAEALLHAAGITYEVDERTDVNTIPIVLQSILSMCVRESVTNIVKHSQAKKCMLDIMKDDGGLFLTIRDDGRGMVGTPSDGNGLKGMAERLSLIEGKLQVKNDKGTTVQIYVPVVSGG
ncbi:sensor histidine kinase [Cytobacillus gottheilii]|uniref:sensor histidine kinase n=1 Tax=Cytobacillus gottheilii TaxID=859144 RepID=UPI00249501DC|nr:sensor histidine kinase [Cytobacillus gottheilii]